VELLVNYYGQAFDKTTAGYLYFRSESAISVTQIGTTFAISTLLALTSLSLGVSFLQDKILLDVGL